MLMYNFIEYGDNYSKTSGILWVVCPVIFPLTLNELVLSSLKSAILPLSFTAGSDETW